MSQLRPTLTTLCLTGLLAFVPLQAAGQFVGQSNLALGKPVVPATNAVRGHPAGVTDGRPSSSWYSYQCAGWSPCRHEWIVDLRAPALVGRLTVYPLQTSAFTLLTSMDGVTWTTRHQYNGITQSGWQYASISNPLTYEVAGAYEARYFKYLGWANWNQYVGTAEFVVNPWVTTPPPPLLGNNLALGRPVADVYPYPAAPGTLAVDDNIDTAWQGGYVREFDMGTGARQGYWFGYGAAVIDLGDQRTINGVRLIPAANVSPQSYLVAFSDSPTQYYPEAGWFALGEASTFGTTLAWPGIKELVLPQPAQARYAHVMIILPITNIPLRPALAEIQVIGYGDDPVLDTTPPVISGLPGGVTVDATGPMGAIVTWSVPAATDETDGPVPVVCSPASGAWFPLGQTAVSCTATDRAGNTTTEGFVVTVVDLTPPELAVTSPLAVELWSPNGKTVPVTITGWVSDLLTPHSALTVRFTVVDEYGLVQPSGTASVADGRFAATVPLEARRLGTDRDGRRYEVTLTVTDGSGNTASIVVVVTVPHDQRK